MTDEPDTPRVPPAEADDATPGQITWSFLFPPVGATTAREIQMRMETLRAGDFIDARLTHPQFLSLEAARRFIQPTQPRIQRPREFVMYQMPSLEELHRSPFAMPEVIEQINQANIIAESLMTTATDNDVVADDLDENNSHNPSLTEMRRRVDAVGFVELTDADVVDKGNYVVVNNPDPGRWYYNNLRVVREELIGQSTLDHYKRYYGTGFANERPAVYLSEPDKYVYLRGMFAEKNGTPDSRYLRYYTTFDDGYGDPRQGYASWWRDGSSDFDGVSGNRVKIDSTWEPITMKDLTHLEKIGYLSAMRRRPRNSSQTRYRIDSMIQTMRNRIYGITQPMHEGERYQVLTVRKLLKEAGELIRASINASINADADEDRMVELLNELREIGDRSASYFYHQSGLRNIFNATDSIRFTWNNNNGGNIIRGGNNCGHYFNEGDGMITSDGEVCQECFDEHYEYAADTGDYRLRTQLFEHEDDDGDTDWRTYPPGQLDYDDGDLSGWGSSTADLRHDTTFTPSQHGDFTMGIELEVEANEYRSRRVRECDEHFNGTSKKKYAMFKRDGSLNHDAGFEIVTAARRMADHIEKFKKWDPEGLTSWDAGNCGMHVHIDSRAFSALTLGKFLMFYNQEENNDFIEAIAGRHPCNDEQAEEYAAQIDQDRADHPVRVKGGESTRYRMVNVTNLTGAEQNRLGISVCRDCKGNYSTVEVRIFRGTLRKARLLAQIEFAHASVAFCRVASWKDLSAKAFKKWLGTTALYPNLSKWYGVSAARNKNYTRALEHAVADEI